MRVSCCWASFSLFFFWGGPVWQALAPLAHFPIALLCNCGCRGQKNHPNNLILKTAVQIGTHSPDILAPMASRAEPSFGIESANSDIIRYLKAPDMTINELQYYPIVKSSGHVHLYNENLMQECLLALYYTSLSRQNSSKYGQENNIAEPINDLASHLIFLCLTVV